MPALSLGLLSTVSRARRRSSTREGVRQSVGNVPVSRQATAQHIAACKERFLIPPISPASMMYDIITDVEML